MAEAGVVKSQKLWLDGYDFSGDLNRILLRSEVETDDNTTFGDNTRSAAPGLHTALLSAAGLYRVDGSTAPDDIISSNLAVADVPITVGVEAGAEGEAAYFFRSLVAEYNPFETGEIGRLLRFAVTAQGSGGQRLIPGTLIHVGSETGDGNAAGYQVGSVAAGQKVYAAMHVLDIQGSGTPTLDVTIESDASDAWAGAETVRFTFTQASAIGSEYLAPLSLPPAVTDDWWRATYDLGATTTSVDFVVVIGII